MKYNKHLVLLSPGFPASEEDDTCLPYLQTLIRGLREEMMDWHISIITFQYPFQKEPYQWHGIDIYPCDGRNRFFPYRWITWKRCRNFFRKINEAHPVNVIHSFWLTECALLGQRLAKAYHLPHLTTLMGQDALPKNRYLKQFRNEFPELIALSDFHAKKFKKTTGKQIETIIPLGIRQGDFPSLNYGERTVDICGVGSLTAGKNFTFFIELIAQLKSNFPDIQCQIAGDGPEKNKLKELIHSHELENNVSLLGHVPRKEVLALMNNSKVFLHTSHYESFGYAILEAQFMGCAVVAGKTGMVQPTPGCIVIEKTEYFLPALEQTLLSANEMIPATTIQFNETAERYRAIYETKTS